MSARLLITAFSLFIFSSLFSQSLKLTGRVSNEKNEPVAGVSINIVGAGGTTSGTDGGFTLNLTTGKKYEINFSAVGYTPKIVGEVEVSTGITNELNVVLQTVSKDLSNIVVTATRSTARRESVNAILQFQKNTNTVASVISAETIRRSPDRNTGEVLKRTPGASIQEGRFIIVRGLADRYNQAMLNGILLTSTEPDRKTFSFDLVPAQMIDNIVINKAFVPELPGEWAGGLIQVNTKDIPAKGFFNVQIGTGFNTQTTGKKFYSDNGGKTDWLGTDDGTRNLPSGYTTKSNFDILSPEEKTALGQKLRNTWSPTEQTAPLNISFQANGGFTTKVFKKTVGGTFGLIYSKNNRYIKQLNRYNTLSQGIFSVNYDFNDDRYSQDVSVGALGSLSVQLNSRNKISLKSIVNLNGSNSVIQRNGYDATRGNGEDLTGSELTFKQNTFYTAQLTGEHTVTNSVRLKWYGAFNILDGYVPDQRRILYSKTTGSQEPYRAIVSNTLSQQSGSRIFQNLSDYIYTGGGDLTYSYQMFNRRQTVKGGYMLQIKDRLYDAKLFANYLAVDNDQLKQLPADKIFAPENFGNGKDNNFGFDAIKGNNFRYLANTILNAGYLQFDNEFSDKLRIVWGLRVENYDQLVGSVKKYDPRHTYSKVTDFLPGVNLTYKLNPATNLRLSGSQTVIRPELRELTFLNLYDFELNASVQGNPLLKRTKVTNADLRYEWYPRAGEVITGGVFYKYFDRPIEQLFNLGGGGASTFNYQNPEKATSYGVEVELRKRFDFINGFKNFTLQANGAYIKSRVQDQGFRLDRPLQGQSPYVLNLGLLYDLEKAGLTATVLYNIVGQRIYVVGSDDYPDIYEASRSLVDLQLSKKIIGSKGELRLNVSDLLNQTLYFYQNSDSKTSFQKGGDAYRFTRKYGTTFALTFNYSL